MKKYFYLILNLLGLTLILSSCESGYSEETAARLLDNDIQKAQSVRHPTQLWQGEELNQAADIACSFLEMDGKKQLELAKKAESLSEYKEMLQEFYMEHPYGMAISKMFYKGINNSTRSLDKPTLDAVTYILDEEYGNDIGEKYAKAFVKYKALQIDKISPLVNELPR